MPLLRPSSRLYACGICKNKGKIGPHHLRSVSLGGRNTNFAAGINMNTTVRGSRNCTAHGVGHANAQCAARLGIFQSLPPRTPDVKLLQRATCSWTIIWTMVDTLKDS